MNTDVVIVYSIVVASSIILCIDKGFLPFVVLIDLLVLQSLSIYQQLNNINRRSFRDAALIWIGWLVYGRLFCEHHVPMKSHLLDSGLSVSLMLVVQLIYMQSRQENPRMLMFFCFTVLTLETILPHNESIVELIDWYLFVLRTLLFLIVYAIDSNQQEFVRVASTTWILFAPNIAIVVLGAIAQVISVTFYHKQAAKNTITATTAATLLPTTRQLRQQATFDNVSIAGGTETFNDLKDWLTEHAHRQ